MSSSNISIQQSKGGELGSVLGKDLWHPGTSLLGVFLTSPLLFRYTPVLCEGIPSLLLTGADMLSGLLIIGLVGLGARPS